jgi:hypothetical protein
MSYNSIRIERDRGGFSIRATDPEIEKANRERNKSDGDCCPVGEWKDPNVEYSFETKEQVLKFLDKAIDVALPKDEYSSAFDKIAKEAQSK